MPTLKERTRSLQRGQVLVLAAVILATLLLFAGLAIDAGLVLQARRDLVRVADAAALAGAGALSSGDAGEANDWVRQQRAVARAYEYAELNGFDPDAAGHALFVEVSFSGGRKLVTVNATRPVDTVFMRLVGIEQVTISAHGEGRQAEAPPLDIMLVQDLSASQCFGTYAEKPAGQDCEYINNPFHPTNPDRAYELPYDASEPTILNNASRWVDYSYPYTACNSSNSGCYPGCPPASGTGAWVRCPGNDASLSPINQPWEPFALQQDAARYFVSKLDARYDQVGLVGFSWDYAAHYQDPYGRDYNARRWADLTTNVSTVMDAIGSSPLVDGQTGDHGLYPGGNTNIAAGLSVGLAELTTSPRGRENAVGVMILLSDGAPTTTLSGSRPSSCYEEDSYGCWPAREDAIEQAQAASDAGVLVYTVFVGTPTHAQRYALMLQYIADLTDDHELDGSYSTLLYNGGPAYDAAYFQQNISQNYFVASNQAELLLAYDRILDMIYTRLVR